MIFDNSMCSLLLRGSASIPIKPNKLVTIEEILSAKRSISSIVSFEGDLNESIIESCFPAELPGV